MKNNEVADVFQDIAGLLELKGENVFKIRAYQRAVQAIEQLPLELEQLMEEGRLKDVPGIGEAISGKITELLTTGRLEYYDRLRAEFPEGIREILGITGVGPRTAMRLLTELGVESVDDLEEAIINGRVAGLSGMGEKTAENILRHLQSMRNRDLRIPIGVALPVAEEIMDFLRKNTGLQNITPGGSLRRFRDTIGDIDLMGTAEDGQAAIDAFTGKPGIKEVLGKGETKASVIVNDGLQVDLRVVAPEAFGSLLQYFTGSQQHNILLRERGQRQGLKLSEYGITDIESGELEKFAAEEDFYHRLGLQFIPPEIREGQQEVERAEQGTIPELVKLSDIKGDFHAHTDWSDGHHSLETMALAARRRGYRYMVITDHSGGLGIAHGLKEDRVREQIAAIRKLDDRLEGFRLLSGIEVDIRADGSLDLPDELLRELDVVIASVHSAMGQPEEKMTGRIIRAMENPNVDIISHPTCRLLGEREPVAADLEAIFKAAARTGAVLEINAMPDRLDLKDIHIYRARELGVKLVIGTDAHGTDQLGYMRYGVGMARRGWCEAGHILNTLPLETMLASLKHRS
ncbi:DNA polymerase/3'-5' exonuclease PolX [Chloroflexota bacterium]